MFALIAKLFSNVVRTFPSLIYPSLCESCFRVLLQAQKLAAAAPKTVKFSGPHAVITKCGLAVGKFAVPGHTHCLMASSGGNKIDHQHRVSQSGGGGIMS